MTEQAKRAGANPAHAAPQTAQTPLEIATAAAAAQLDDTLKRAGRLLDRCQTLADDPGELAVPALQAAARILKTQTETAATLARVVRGESRHRTIVEYPDGMRAELNSKILESPPPTAGNGKLPKVPRRKAGH